MADRLSLRGSIGVESQNPQAAPLSTWTKVIYAFPNFALGGAGVFVTGFLAKFYSDNVGLPLSYISYIQFAGGVSAAFTIVFAGWFSDKLNWEFGRRRPLLLLAAPFAGLGFMFLFFPVPPIMNGRQTGKEEWFLVSFLVYINFNAISELAAGALRIEVTQNDQERQSIFVYAGAAVGVGVLVGSGLSALGNFTVVGIGIGSLYIFSNIVMAALTRENPEFWRKGVPIIPAFRACANNTPWVRYFLAQIVIQGQNQLTSVYTFVIQYVFLADPNIYFAVFGVVYAGGSALFIPAWNVFLKKYKVGKVRGFVICQYLLIVHGIVVLASTYINIYVFILAQPLFAMWSSGHNIIDAIMLADVVDYDELKTGTRREGAYYSISSLPNTFFGVVFRAIPLILLDTFGFDPDLDTEQSTSVQNTLRLVVGGGPILIGIIGLLVIWDYPITESLHHRILMEVKNIKDGKPAINPITQERISRHKKSELLAEVDEDLDLDWISDYFSRHEILNIAESGADGVSSVLRELYATVSIWAIGTGLSFALGIDIIIQKRTDEAPDMGFMSIFVGVFFLFNLAYDLARIPTIKKVNNSRNINDIIEVILTNSSSVTAAEIASLNGGVDLTDLKDVSENAKTDLLERGSSRRTCWEKYEAVVLYRSVGFFILLVLFLIELFLKV